jgi:ribosomal protein L24
MIIDEETKKPSRVGYRKEAHSGLDGTEKVRKVRLSKRSGKDI